MAMHNRRDNWCWGAQIIPFGRGSDGMSAD